MLTSITGINWGDEGKGRMVDLLSQDYDIVARYQGGDNAGHTVKTERGKFVLNLIPSGILRPDVVCVMGGGMVIDPEHLEKEIASLTEKGVEISPKNLKISDRATITMPFHVAQDGLEEERLSKTGAQFGSTKRGIAYSYGDKYMKKTLRMGDLVHMDASVRKRLETIVESKNLTMEKIYGQKPVSVDEMWAWCEKYSKMFAPYICDVGDYLDKADREGKKIMFEAQLGALRDIDFGIYPYTSSSNTVSAYAPIGAGIPGHLLGRVDADGDIGHDVPAGTAQHPINRGAVLLAQQIPQGHVHTGDRIVLDGAIAPVAVLVHELPDVVDVRNIPADQQRAQIFFHHQLDGQMPVSEGTAAQAIQARLAGFHLHHQKVDAFRRGADGFDVSDGYHESLLIGSGRCRRSQRTRTGRTLQRSR